MSNQHRISQSLVQTNLCASRSLLSPNVWFCGHLVSRGIFGGRYAALEFGPMIPSFQTRKDPQVLRTLIVAVPYLGSCMLTWTSALGSPVSIQGPRGAEDTDSLSWGRSGPNGRHHPLPHEQPPWQLLVFLLSGNAALILGAGEVQPLFGWAGGPVELAREEEHMVGTQGGRGPEPGPVSPFGSSMVLFWAPFPRFFLEVKTSDKRKWREPPLKSPIVPWSCSVQSLDLGQILGKRKAQGYTHPKSADLVLAC